MVQKLYVPNGFRQEILCVVMSCVVESLALEFVMRNLKLLGLFVLAQSVVLVCVHT